MGEVYRASDTNLKRAVAVKVLPESVAADRDRLARFQREAEVLASLNHSNIAAIYGLERSEGVTALVMEMVEGPTLADRIGHGPIPIDEVLSIARQIADALESAHEHGIIHRDLKPANIKLRDDGTVKVLDFGLAKAVEPMPSAPNMSRSPTITSPAMMTGVGVLLGTAAYMAPEQARGKPVDKRADIWAFGCVLYEMLTGQRAFGGDDVTVTLSRVVERDPDFDALPPTVPQRVRQALRVCLRKDPKQRAHDIADIRMALEGAFETVAATTTSPSSVPRGRLAWAAFAVAGVLFVALALPAVRHLRETPTPSPPETRTEIVTPATDLPASFALSPDGRQIVFVASGDATSRLWLRSLATTTAQPLAGTEGATYPFWAPDSRSVAFFAGNALMRLDVGGVPQPLARVVNGSGGTWTPDGDIVFAPSRTSPIMRVSATGGAAAPVTTLGPRQQAHLWPVLLPDGHRFLFYVIGPPETAGIYLGSRDGGAPTRLVPADGAGAYLPEGSQPAGAARGGGWLLWVRAGTLVAQRLAEAQSALEGDPIKLADGVAVDGIAFRSALSVAPTGLVAYRTGSASRRQLTWYDRSGTTRGTVGSPDESGLSNPRVSPSGQRVAVVRSLQGNSDIWLLDGGRASKVTVDAANDSFPLWSPDGARIVFRSNRAGNQDLFQTLINGAGVEERIVPSDEHEAKIPYSWSKHGFLLYAISGGATETDLWIVPMSGDRTPSVFLKTQFREVWGAFSPDGQWVAFVSNESGQPEVYVRRFVPPGTLGTEGATETKWPVSTSGGAYPLWRPDGKELYYLNPAGAMVAVPMTVVGSRLERGAPAVLFSTRIFGGGTEAQQGRQYDVAPDGRFLINTVLDSGTAPITLLQNWNPEAKR